MRRFAGTGELTPADALAADIRSIPRPSILEGAIEARGKTAKGLETLGSPPTAT